MSETTKKKKVFIGSSSEAEQYLTDVKKELGREFEVIAWNDPEVFSLNNQSFLDSLIKQSYLVDFAIFLATSDDITNSRNKEQEAPRDNVIFEFGMFLQSLGKERCFMLVEDGCKILTDMTGITLKMFSKDGNNDLKKAMAELKNNLLQKKRHIPSLTTTGLAYGYYQNFVKKLAAWKKCKQLTIYMKKCNFDPDDYEDAKNIPVRHAFHEKDNNEHYADYPTTLNALDDVIREKNELSESEKDTYRERELNNFQIAIERLVENEAFKKKIVFKT